ncbi:MAG: hypothetical protein N3E37_00165 [Candidatus Micrarchaeota archaeon]|nr:hypothetical protein [Candidatus Micrarchaeota archaeon]
MAQQEKEFYKSKYEQYKRFVKSYRRFFLISQGSFSRSQLDIDRDIFLLEQYLRQIITSFVINRARYFNGSAPTGLMAEDKGFQSTKVLLSSILLKGILDYVYYRPLLLSVEEREYLERTRYVPLSYSIQMSKLRPSENISKLPVVFQLIQSRLITSGHFTEIEATLSEMHTLAQLYSSLFIDQEKLMQLLESTNHRAINDFLSSLSEFNHRYAAFVEHIISRRIDLSEEMKNSLLMELRTARFPSVDFFIILASMEVLNIYSIPYLLLEPLLISIKPTAYLEKVFSQFIIHSDDLENSDTSQTDRDDFFIFDPSHYSLMEFLTYLTSYQMFSNGSEIYHVFNLMQNSLDRFSSIELSLNDVQIISTKLLEYFHLRVELNKLARGESQGPMPNDNNDYRETRLLINEFIY